MKLLTLGGLRVEGASYRREKPLLLLAYLLLEGPQPRRRLADLFWPDAANPMNSLAQNLIRLRPLGAVTETDQRVEAYLPCDAVGFRAHHRAARWTDATTAYTGEFLEGLRLDLPPDLEEWLLDTRDTLASEARAAHLTLAEHHHARAEPTPAHAHAERAYRTPGAPPCPPEDLTRLWHLLGGTDHPLTLHLRRDADDLGLRLPTPTPPTPDHTLIGRHDELGTLTGLPTGSVAWISGPPGIGKTTLLRALSRHGWRLLSARGGLPLATLEPLSPHPLSSTADALNLLRDTRLKLAIDDWEDCDDTTRAALTLAARQTPGATIAITARHPPTIPTPHHLPLHSLTEHDLQGHPGAHAATGGHPTLLTAYLNGTPPDRTLDAHLRHLGDDHRRLFLALATQDTPNLGATRAALNLSAATLAGTLDTLTREGLTTPDGSIRASTPARHLLDTHPLDTTLTHLHLARHHPIDTAWPHWLAARDLWEDHDHTPCAAAAHWHADQEMKRGYPARAARTLEVAPQTDEVKLLRGWALIKGQNPYDVLRLINDLPETPDVLALHATALAYASRPEEAEAIARHIPHNATPAHAHSENVLGYVARQREDYEAARRHYHASASLWKIHNGREWIEVAAILAAVNCVLGGEPRYAFQEVMEAIHLFPTSAPSVYPNYAHALKQTGLLAEAQQAALQGLQALEGQEDQLAEMSLHNSLGVYAHLAGEVDTAVQAYRTALQLAHRCGNFRAVGLITANLSEIEGDASSMADTLRLLMQAGQEAYAHRIQQNIAERQFAQQVQSRVGHAQPTT
ncbi:ATP-binding protein [Deinococcus daejeonensis]|uniref:Transcriptional regulator, SARP family n=1 Tax=Deinococcus daejeonensis TaxID=1007098 RepID=A0ABQ2IYR4_9DEIO|nr:ATP-binding protein [Deinococcus daejeonensis]GGN31614.1 hypothetical protein GCM10010842_07640 [Deinococcus daejeonensis]